MLFNEENEIAGFLGVHIYWSNPDQIVFTQVSLIPQIISALNTDQLSIVHTPATKYLPIDEDGDPPQGIYNYASVVGQLNYLTGYSRCDLGIATSQVVHYLHWPCRSHELALE